MGVLIRPHESRTKSHFKQQLPLEKLKCREFNHHLHASPEDMGMELRRALDHILGGGTEAWLWH